MEVRKHNNENIVNIDSTKDTTKKDRELVWHPFTQEKTADAPIAIKSGKGAYIFDEYGNKYLDLISSWWVNIHGHAHHDIANSIYQQARKLEHVIFAGFTHEPAVQLCEMLSEILPPELEKFFFSDNGSTAVEVALKMALQYWYNKGEEKRSIFLSFEGGYHGDTFGAMSVGRTSGFHDPFKKHMFKALTLPFPATWEGDKDVLRKERECLECLHQYLDTDSKRIAAIILEPIIQGASGMRMCRPEFLRNLVGVLRWHNILVIFDEVMTGFGRTGKNFALEHVGITPDFLCVSKALTGGFLPLALTITSEKIYNAFFSNKEEHAFTHGHSYTANPIACAAAITSLKLLMQSSSKHSISAIERAHKKGMKYLKAHCKNAINLRMFGTISAFEVNLDTPNINKEMKRRFINAGLLIRPLGNTVYLIPPYCVSEAELEEVYNQVASIVNSL